MDSKEHWEELYRSKAPDAVSWYRPHLDTSLRLIGEVASDRNATIIDVGGGESTLVDDLVERGYRNLTVLDTSAVALNTTKRRLGTSASHIVWVESDITTAQLPQDRYDVWHDRAVFHFLTEPSQRDAYVQLLSAALRPGGHVVMGTFGPAGPTSCSGLHVMRYDANSLFAEMGPGFELSAAILEDHHTPAGATQQFLYCCFRKQ
ncbi:methyltransferase family protein [Paraburkholderia sp. BL23I1N1]|uniref:class I SAM-dependent methyltransferase n=1 Tax=Paraburkholderia sp. BL23I1N1 TaxID=1938802 RepID=UPI000E70726E|nr:class I SAM-dependent methyltransferase [Paraburkholderia sp. BL23I1N1]RKE25222.1 methyltransferase family protein [Paraburkholderia sp. BL23I1N1]